MKPFGFREKCDLFSETSWIPPGSIIGLRTPMIPRKNTIHDLSTSHFCAIAMILTPSLTILNNLMKNDINRVESKFSYRMSRSFSTNLWLILSILCKQKYLFCCFSTQNIPSYCVLHHYGVKITIKVMIGVHVAKTKLW